LDVKIRSLLKNACLFLGILIFVLASDDVLMLMFFWFQIYS
jgi:hypothetical protein